MTAKKSEHARRHVTKSTGNVFADLGINKTDAKRIAELESIREQQATIIRNREDEIKELEAAQSVSAKAVPVALASRLIKHYEYGQFADDFNQPLAFEIRKDLRDLCETLTAAPTPAKENE